MKVTRDDLMLLRIPRTKRRCPFKYPDSSIEDAPVEIVNDLGETEEGKG